MTESNNMSDDKNISNKVNDSKKDSALAWDKTLLLSFVTALSILFIVLNREANGFFPDARLYPYVMTIIGLVIAGLSVFRIITGKEPNIDAQNGKDWSLSAEHTRQAYKKTIIYLLMFSGFYLGIWVFGFRPAAVFFVFGFIRSFGHSYLVASVYALCGLLMLEILSRVLSLVLPTGLLIDFILT